QTAAFAIGEVGDSLDTLGDLGLKGAVLVVRSGGGRSGETFAFSESPTVIGRSPECGIFLDDVTVSRKHAVFPQEGDRWNLEDQGLLNPRRTQGGYRLFTEDDVERLETILRLQRDEFLPLWVIKEELAAGAGQQRKRRRAATEGEEELDLDDLCARGGISRE